MLSPHSAADGAFMLRPYMAGSALLCHEGKGSVSSGPAL